MEEINNKNKIPINSTIEKKKETNFKANSRTSIKQDQSQLKSKKSVKIIILFILIHYLVNNVIKHIWCDDIIIVWKLIR